MKKIYALLFIFSCFFNAALNAQSNSTFQVAVLEFPKVITQNTKATLNLLITNTGKEIQEDMVINYAIDEAKIASQVITLNVPQNGSQRVDFTYVYELANEAHTLKIDFLNKFNVALANALEVEFLVARTTVPQLPLVEEFTSSTCGPCASFNNTFDPFLSSMNTNQNNAQVAAVKYQMNWPSPSTDPSYNSDGNGRKNFYAVSGIPKSFLNGVATTTFNQSVIDGASGESAFKLVPYFYLSGDTVKATCTATSYTSLAASLKIQMALTEDYYDYTGGTTSQTTFHYVMRKMLPNYVGTVISNVHEDTTYTTNRNYKVTYGNVAINNFNIWGTSAGFTLVAWIQNTTTKEVYQAAVAHTPSAMSLIENIKENSLEVFPNPANDFFTVKLELTEKADVTYTLNDLTGKLIQQPVVQSLPAGKHVLQTSTLDLLPGIYLCTVQANNQIFTKRIVITH